MMFRDQVGIVAGWFRGWSECEQTVALLALLKRVTRTQARFLQLCLEHSLADCPDIHLLEAEANSAGEGPGGRGGAPSGGLRVGLDVPMGFWEIVWGVLGVWRELRGSLCLPRGVTWGPRGPQLPSLCVPCPSCHLSMAAGAS